METITMWADLSSNVADARRKSSPAHDVRNVIVGSDIAKIKQDAADAIANDVKNTKPVFSKVSDRETIEWFENQPKRSAYRAMQMATDFVMDMAKQNEAVGVKTHVLTSEQAVAELAKMEREGNEVRFMGSRVPKRRKTIQKEIGGGNYSPITSEIVRAYIDEDYEPTINFVDVKGNRRNLFVEQGGERRVGVRHSLFQHFGTDKNYIDSSDILKIENILSNGTRVVEGNKAVYRKTIDGVKFTVVTRIKKGGREIFENYYSNKNPQTQQGASNTLPQAQASKDYNANIEQTNSKLEGNNVKNDKTEVLKTSDGTVYGWTKDGEIYLTPAGVNPNTPVHEYAGHIWGPAVRKNNPELWNQIKELAKQTKLWVTHEC